MNPKIHWSHQILSAHITEIDKELDIALLSVELTDYQLWLSLNEDVVSFEALRVPGHKALTVKGFEGDAEKIIFEADGDDIGPGDSGTPLFHPRTRSVCGLIRGRDGKTKAVMAVHNKKREEELSQISKQSG
jgi:hypothetical protein